MRMKKYEITDIAHPDNPEKVRQNIIEIGRAHV